MFFIPYCQCCQLMLCDVCCTVFCIAICDDKENQRCEPESSNENLPSTESPRHTTSHKHSPTVQSLKTAATVATAAASPSADAVTLSAVTTRMCTCGAKEGEKGDTNMSQETVKPQTSMNDVT